MTYIAVLGTGHMGAPIARRLLGAGHRVTVWNRSPARASALAGTGARIAASPRDAARGAQLVITVLTDGDAVSEALFGPDGAAAAMHGGTCLVEMSTSGPTAVAQLRARLPAGVDLVDAPVSGSVDAAAAGRLRVLAGGDPHVVDRIAPVLEALGSVRRCGPSGSGAALKLVLNTALVTGLAALADVLAVANAVGVDRDTALAALADGPLGLAARRVAEAEAAGAGTGGGSFAIALARKDVDLALAELGSAPAPLAWAAADRLAAEPDQNADLRTILRKESP